MFSYFGLCFLLAVSNAVAQRTLSDVEYYCGNKPADVVFLLDVSNSIWAPDFVRQLQFVTNVIDMFEIAENVTRVGISTFSSNVFREFYLNEYYDKAEMRRAIARIRQRQGYHTNTGLALWQMRRQMFNERSGARPGVAKIGIILTDGQSHNIGRTMFEAYQTKRKDIHLFAIGIGSRVNQRELKAIASYPEDEYVFMVDSYSALNAIQNSLAVRTCKVTTPSTTTSTTITTPTTTTTTTPSTTTSLYDVAKQACTDRMLDVVFAIDSSSSIDDADYVKQAEFFSKLAESFDISPQTTRIGSILYSDQIQEMFSVVEHESIEGVRKGMTKLGMTAGSSRVDLALKHILTNSFRRSYTRRGASQIGIIITGSPSRYLELSKHMVKKANNAGIQYIAIGVGDKPDEEELRIIVGPGDMHHLHRLNSFDDLLEIVPHIAMQICQVAAPKLEFQDQVCGSKQEADIMFLMDSVNAGRRNTRTALAFLKSLVNEFDVDNDNIHVGLMSAECVADTEGFPLGSHESRKHIEESIDKMKGTDFHDIIKEMRKKSFRTRTGARKHAKKIAILIVDGELEDPIKTLNEARRAKIHGVEVFVIQVGDQDPQPELQMMCDESTNQRYFKVKHYEDLEALKQKILQSLCDDL